MITPKVQFEKQFNEGSSAINKVAEDYNLLQKEKQKLAYDMTDEEVAKSIDLEISDFDESGDMLDE